MEGREYRFPDVVLRQIVQMAAAAGWAKRDSLATRTPCSKCGDALAPSFKFTNAHRDLIVREVMAAIDMALQQQGAKPKRTLLYGPDGNTPVAEG